MRHANPRARSGFTLIELLVVIAIIAILAAILFPVFARARESGRRTSCLSNMKQIGIGLEQYKTDNDSTFPQAYYYNDGVSSSSLYTQWTGMTQPYLKSIQVFKCPSSKGLPPTNSTRSGECSVDAAQPPTTYASQFAGDDNQVPCSSYIANELVLPRMKLTAHVTSADNSAQYSAGVGMQTVNDSVIDRSSEVIMIAEMNDQLNNLSGTSTSGGSAQSKTHRPTSGVKEPGTTFYESEDGTAAPLIAITLAEAEDAIANPGTTKSRIQYTELDRHLGGGNYLFADGHAKWYKLSQTLNPSGFLWGKKAYSVRGTPTIYQADGVTPVG